MELESPTTALNPRNSALNRTMVVSKKAQRRPGLPEVKAVDSTLSKPRGAVVPFSPTMVGDKLCAPKPVERPSTMGPLLERVLREKSGEEVQKCVLETARGKEREWNAALDKHEGECSLHAELCRLRVQSADRTSQRALQLFRICEHNGIDLEAILVARPDAVQQLQLRQPSAQSARSSPLATPHSERSDPESSVLAKLTQERDALGGEVRSLEENYSNLFRLYEKMRLSCVALKETEQSVRTELQEMGRKYAALHQMYTELLFEAQAKLSGAQGELHQQQKANEEKTLGVRLALKRARLQIGTLETALQSKSKENEELRQICDQLIEARDAKMAVSLVEEEEEEDPGERHNLSD